MVINICQFCFALSMKQAHTITLSHDIKHRMIDHAQRELPDECCGVLLGKNSIVRIVPMKSTPAAPDSYFMDPEQQVAVFTEMESRGEKLIGIYHSHPEGPPEPSGMDLQLAFHPEAVYFIISLEDKDRPEIKAFVLENGEFKEVLLKYT